MRFFIYLKSQKYYICRGYFEGTTGPYVQYTYALIKVLVGYEAAIWVAAERYEPSIIARYVISVATAFNKFYHDCPILQAEKEQKKARLALVDITQRVIKEACSLLGMECPEKM